jgi:mono/diheme cytochrome c family protein
MSRINISNLPSFSLRGFLWMLPFLLATAYTLIGTGSSLAADEAAAQESNDMQLPMDNADSAEKGRERYSERCAFCHGGGGRGAKGPCLVCGHFKRGGKDSQIYANIAAGVPGTQMGAFGTSLQQEEITNILVYLRLEQKKRAQEEGQK